MAIPLGGLESCLYSQSKWPGCGHRYPILAALMPGTDAHRGRDRLASDPQLHHIWTKELTFLHPSPQPSPFYFF